MQQNTTVATGTVSTSILLLIYAIQCVYGEALTIPTVTAAAHARFYCRFLRWFFRFFF